MTISQVPGAVRLRFNQFGVQSVLNTAVAATKRTPWRGGIVVEPNWTDPDIDEGSLDPVAAPYPGLLDITSTKTGSAYYNDMPLRLLAGLKGGVTPTTSTTDQAWDFQIASLSSDVFDIFTNETGDDTEATDTTIGIGGVIDSLEDTYPQDLGAVQISDNWVYSTATLGQNGTDSLVVDASAIPILGRDLTLKMDSTAGSIGNTLLSGTSGPHEVVVRVQNNLDRKRLMSGSNSANQLAGYGRGDRVIELVLTVPKSSSWITEANTILTSPKPSRFFDVGVFSTSETKTGTPYSDRHRGAFRLFTKSETEIGSNVALVLTYRAYYDATLGYAYRRTVHNTAATAV